MVSARNAFEENEPFTLQDSYLGPRAGRYVVRAEHTVQGKADKPEWKGEAEVSFEVAAPRLALPSPGVVHACYPPPNSEGPFRDLIPYVSLSRRSLPWERALSTPSADASPEERATPWVALLVLNGDDLKLGEIRATKGATLASADTASFYAPWSDATLADDFALTADERKADVTVLELDARRFRELCPKVAELRSLVHVRTVDARSKRIGDEQATAHYAVVLANRFPCPGEQTAALVSLEGWSRWLGDAAASSAPKVRVVVLHRWTFNAREGIGSTAQWVRERLSIGALTMPREVLERADAASRGPLYAGYVPVEWRPAARDAVPDFGWYHGPLTVRRTEGFGDDVPTFEHPDAALIVDESTGVVDHSYAAAWQIGRLAALSSASFAQALRRWSRGVFLEAMRQEELRGGAVADASTAALQTLADAIRERYQARSSAATAAPNDDVRVAAEWLADLMLLMPVPFRHLVPSDKLLPPESLRGFYIDGRWLDALADGAISIGVASLKNRAPLRSKRGALRRVLRWLMLHRRALSRGESLPAYVETDASAVEKPLSGFVLRSEMFKAFPGVEVELFGWSDPERRAGELERLEPLRVDMIADGVLLVIARGTPDRIVVREPREGLRFGLVEQRLYPRLPTGARENNPAFDVRLRETAALVIDVGALASKIGGQSPAAGARYALQWLLPPQDVWTSWEDCGR